MNYGSRKIKKWLITHHSPPQKTNIKSLKPFSGFEANFLDVHTLICSRYSIIPLQLPSLQEKLRQIGYT
jgi:hypothetical protein